MNAFSELRFSIATMKLFHLKQFAIILSESYSWSSPDLVFCYILNIADFKSDVRTSHKRKGKLLYAVKMLLFLKFEIRHGYDLIFEAFQLFPYWLQYYFHVCNIQEFTKLCFTLHLYVCIFAWIVCV